MTNYQDEWMAAVLGPLVPETKLSRLKNDTESKSSLWERIIDARLLTEAEVLDAVAARCKLPIAEPRARRARPRGMPCPSSWLAATAWCR